MEASALSQLPAPPREPPAPAGANRRSLDARRLGAFLLDGLFATPLWFLAAWITGGEVELIPDSWTELGGTGLFAVVALAFGLYYFFAFEALGGQTPGKRLFGLRVLRADGSEPGLGAVVVRTLGRLLDHSPVGVIVFILSGQRRQRVGDIAAATIVTREKPGPLFPEGLAGVLAAQRAVRFTPGRLVASIFIALVVLFTAVGSAAEIKDEVDRTQASATVRGFLAAATDGQSRRACRMLTPAHRADLVRESGSRDCRRAVRRLYGRSFVRLEGVAYTPDELRALQPAIAVDDAVGWPAMAAAYGSGSEPLMSLVKVDGRWRIDPLVFLRRNFVTGCEGSGGSRPVCSCLFDGLRGRGIDTTTEIAAMEARLMSTGSASAEVEAARRACGLPPG